MLKVDYNFYAFDYYSDGEKPLIPVEDFRGYSSKAESEVAAAVFEREISPEYETAVKNCICELADAVYEFEHRNAEHQGIASEKVGDCSVTYVSEEYYQNALQSRKRSIIKLRLAGTGLLFGGIY